MNSLKTLILLVLISLALANPIEDNMLEEEFVDFEQDADDFIASDLAKNEVFESSRGGYKLELCSKTKHCPDGFKCMLASLDQAVYICTKK
ncbi:hypothetical protein TCAL_04545 [Tigriopus californicus]|uniref:Uncharacterized protein n=1 Tax=Tigriopus californicus TaxID=6832 RepID=A0A553PRG9_TIGCA|nr:hypothetical protein TCAL_04545 [Tigriopus californicus]|eukprot:TCALIF_04545-PA protein Name:"Protein of unknown function" AED:0.00 eAED:0.00 QI:86/1/1/1/0.75/1/5/97/90